MKIYDEITNEELTDRLAAEIAQAMPALTDAQIAHLAALLDEGRRSA